MAPRSRTRAVRVLVTDAELEAGVYRPPWVIPIANRTRVRMRTSRAAATAADRAKSNRSVALRARAVRATATAAERAESKRSHARRMRIARKTTSREAKDVNTNRMRIVRATCGQRARAHAATRSRLRRSRWGDAERALHTARARRVRTLETTIERERKDEAAYLATFLPSGHSTREQGALSSLLRHRARRRVRRNTRRREVYKMFRAHLRLAALTPDNTPQWMLPRVCVLPPCAMPFECIFVRRICMYPRTCVFILHTLAMCIAGVAPLLCHAV
jgi:hypothetical protein